MILISKLKFVYDTEKQRVELEIHICHCGQISLQRTADFMTIWHFRGNIYFAGNGIYIYIHAFFH